MRARTSIRQRQGSSRSAAGPAPEDGSTRLRNLDADSPTYTPSLVDVGADRLAAAGTITAATAAALKAVARARAAAGRYFGQIGYASLLARS